MFRVYMGPAVAQHLWLIYSCTALPSIDDKTLAVARLRNYRIDGAPDTSIHIIIQKLTSTHWLSCPESSSCSLKIGFQNINNLESVMLYHSERFANVLYHYFC